MGSAQAHSKGVRHSNRWNEGLGSLLTGYCLEVAKTWGVPRVVAETSRDNRRIIATFRDHGFRLDFDPEAGVVRAEIVLE